jgi:hypothetical protein
MAPIIQNVEMPDGQQLDQRWHGRLYAPDPRDRFHTMAGQMQSRPRSLNKIRTQAPQRGPTLDQGPTSMCVEFSAATALGALPIGYGRTPEKVLSAVQVHVKESANDGWPDLYSWAQDHDEWPGNNYDGTSVRAGQQYLRLIGKSSGFVFAQDLAEAKDYIKRVGSAPIILGIDWLEKMDEPELIKGSYYLTAEGPVVGGHAICCLWFDRIKKAWKLQNTWGEEWGDKGIVYLPDDQFDYLVFQANGEAVSFVEAKAA